MKKKIKKLILFSNIWEKYREKRIGIGVASLELAPEPGQPSWNPSTAPGAAATSGKLSTARNTLSSPTRPLSALYVARVR